MNLFKAFAAAVAAFYLTGCVNLPPEVKGSVGEVRNVTEQLHRIHSQDARAVVRAVERREQDLRGSVELIRATLIEKAKAEGEAFKNKMMSEYDREARELIGIQLVAQLREQLVENFTPAENRAEAALREAQTN